MPKFSEQEKVRIEQLLLTEGERLFIAYGLKKVTIDDIVKAVNIAKASFYKFYQGKEYLFLDIVQREQKEIFEILEETLEESKEQKDCERVKNAFAMMFVLMRKYPLLQVINEETTGLIMRKVSPERLTEFHRQGFDAVNAMVKKGITFKYDTQIVSHLFRVLYQSWVSLQGQPEGTQKQVIDIMLEGVIQQIV